MRRSLFAALLASLLLVIQASPASGEPERDMEEARTHFERGVELFRRGDTEAALAEFDRAYELSGHWGVLYNLGLVHAAVRDYPAAVENLERYLREGGAAVPAERRAAVQAELERLRALIGRIELDIEGPEEAVLSVDGVQAGVWPERRRLAVSAGRHVVEVRAEGFLPVRRSVLVAGGEEVPLQVRLEEVSSRSGAIVLEANVPGAEVSLDGTRVGTTPLDQAILAPAGRHVVEVSRAGYETVGRVVELSAGDLESLSITLQPSPDLQSALAAELDLAVSETDAEVSLDGEPLTDGPIPAGPHRLVVERAGFEPWEREIELPAGRTTHLDVELQPTPTYLRRYLQRARRWRLAAWLTTAAGVAVLGADLGLYLWNRRRDLDWARESAFLVKDAVAAPPTLSEDESRQRYDDLRQLGHELRAWSVALSIALGVGLAALAAGVSLFAAGPDPHRYDRFSIELTPAISPEGFMLGLAGRF